MIGDGPERHRVEAFARSVGGDKTGACFLSGRIDAHNELARAALVWVPSLKPCGAQVALEAQAAGVPVLASRLPELAAVIADGETGVLVSPGDPVGLAKATRKLVENPAERARLGQAARRKSASGHSPAEVAAWWREVYAR